MKWKLAIYRATWLLVLLQRRLLRRKHYIPLWRWRMMAWCYEHVLIKDRLDRIKFEG